MNGTNPLLIAILGWLAAASATRAVTADAVFAPLRVVHQQQVTGRALVLRDTIRAMPPDHPKRWSKTRKFEWLLAWADFYGCPWCIGLWVYAATAATAWVAMGFPAVVWGGQAWFTVPAAALAGRWVYGIVVKWVDPAPHPAPAATVLKN